jgi:signal transduction histidine kinase
LGWPSLVLLVGIAAVVLAGVEVSRSIRSHREVAERAREGYGTFALWSYREHLAGALRNAAREVVGAVNHGQQEHTSPQIPPAASLGHYLPYEPACGCHRTQDGPLPLAFYGFTLGSDTMGMGPNFHEDPSRGWLADPAGTPFGAAGAPRLPDEEGRWLSGELAAAMRSPPSSWGYRWLVAEWQGEPRFFASTAMPTAWGDTVVYAAEYPASAMDSLFQAVLDDRGLLPVTAESGRERLSGGSHREVLALQVSTPQGVPITTWAPPSAWSAPPATMPASYGGFRLRMEIVPEMVDRLVVGGLPQTRTPVLIGLLVLAAGLTGVAALLVRRELRFARVREDFVANVSHELRTPLAQIRLALDALVQRASGTDDARRRGVAIIDRETLRLQHLVDDVLRFRQTGVHDVASQRAPVELMAELGAIIEEFGPIAEGRGSTIMLEAGGPCTVALEPGALRHVMLNLLENAVRYGAARQAIRVGLAPTTREAVITVSDEGSGVPPPERATIWKPYHRGTAASHRAAGGSGLGLAVVREVVERHGGRVDVGAAPGGGAQFVIVFPRVDA